MLAISNPYYMCSTKPQRETANPGDDKSRKGRDKLSERSFSFRKSFKWKKSKHEYANVPLDNENAESVDLVISHDLTDSHKITLQTEQQYVNSPPVDRQFVRRSNSDGKMIDPSRRSSVDSVFCSKKSSNKVKKSNVRCVRRQCPDCSKTGYSSYKTVDVAIFYGKDAQVWGDYLNTCFKKLNPHPDSNLRSFTTSCESIESIELPLTNAKIEQVQSSKLQLIVVSPGFLQHVYRHPSAVIGQLFSPEKVLAVLVGVDDRKDVKEEHRAALPTYLQWKKMYVRQQDTQFIEDLIIQATKIIMKSTPAIKDQKPGFKLSERKIREGESKLFIILDNPLEEEDVIKIFVEKGGSSKGYLFQVSSVRIINPYTIKFQVPDSHLTMSSLINVHLLKNERSQGVRALKYESKLSELSNHLKSINNPIEVMCQSLGLYGESRDVLDEVLANNFRQHNLPTHSSLLDFSKQVEARKTKDEFPTLLHFAARYGLKELTSVILDCPGAEAACRIRNRCGCTPDEIANAAGFKNLADTLINFVQTYQLSNLYSHLAQACEKNDEDEIYESIKGILDSHHLYSSLSVTEEECINFEEQTKEANIGDYDKPRPVDDTYLVPNPVTRPLPPLPQDEEIDSKMFHTYCSMKSIANDLSENDARQSNPPVTMETRPPASRTASLQQELIEIMEGFRANYFTIREVEMLFQDWLSRTEVKKSFEQKELQLRNMRQLYTEAIKQQSESIKSKYTVSSEKPLGKLLSLISRRTPKKKLSISSPSCIPCNGDKTDDGRTEDGMNRPCSSLSLLSTISSERSSRTSLASRGSSIEQCDNCVDDKTDKYNSFSYPPDFPGLPGCPSTQATIMEESLDNLRPELPLPRGHLDFKKLNSIARQFPPNESYIAVLHSSEFENDYIEPDPKITVNGPPTFRGLSKSMPSSPSFHRKHSPVRFSRNFRDFSVDFKDDGKYQEYLEMSCSQGDVSQRKISAPEIKVSPVSSKPQTIQDAVTPSSQISPIAIEFSKQNQRQTSNKTTSPSGVRKMVFQKLWGGSFKKSDPSPSSDTKQDFEKDDYINSSTLPDYVNLVGLVRHTEMTRQSRRCRLFNSHSKNPPPLPPRKKF